MLVLSRNCESEICIGDDVTIKVLEIHKRHVKLGIQAPSRVAVRRRELLLTANRSQTRVERRAAGSRKCEEP